MSQRAAIESSNAHGKLTRRGRFLADVDRIIPWAQLESALQQLYQQEGIKVGRATSPRRMLRVYLLQHWFHLSDAALEEALLDSAAMRQFARITRSADPVPDEKAICALRTLLTRHPIGEEILSAVRRQLLQHGIQDAAAETPRVVEITAVPHGRSPIPETSRTLPLMLGATQPVETDPHSHPELPAAVELALAALGVGVFQLNPVGRMLRFSARCREICGLSPDEEPSEERLLALVHPEDRHLLPALYDAFRPRGPGGFAVEVRVIRPDGMLRWVRMSGRTVFEDSPDGRQPVRCYGTMLDVTERRLTERRLYELDSQLSTFIDGAPGSIATFDREMRFLEVSRQYAEDRGVTPADLIGRQLYEVFPNIPERWRAAHARCLQGATERCDLDVYVRPDGTREWTWWEIRPWYRADQTVGGIVLVSEIITQRLRAQRRLHDSEARLEVAIRAGALGIYDYDLVEKKTTWDARVRELWGVGPHEPISFETFISRVHPEDRAATLTLLEESLGAQSNGTHSAEYRVVNPQDGSIRWISSTGTVFFDQGSAIRLVGIVQDITDRKQAELALAKSAEELRRADERKDAFLATLSHELRNPLAPIRTAAEILASPSLTAAQLGWARQVIQRQTAHMASLLDDLLDVARVTRGKLVLKKQKVGLKSIVDSAVEAARPLVDEKGHRLLVSLPAPDVQLTADPLRLSQVLSNLLGNAAKYTEPGGQIELSAQLEGSTLHLSVKDNGIGIPPEALSQIFNMFWQVERPDGRGQGGLGIGLAFVKSLVELHGGTIEASSGGRGCGSELVVHLPADAPAAEAEAPAPAGFPKAATGGGHRVLLADDNEDAADSLAMLLTLAGHEVRVAHGGRAALETAKEFQPDVALIDLGMPETDGYAVATALREAPWAASLHLVALTGRGLEEDRQRTHAAGFDHHLVKPVNPQALDQLLSRLADQ